MRPLSDEAGDPLDSPQVRAAIRQAWEESRSDEPDDRHEEGGYIVRNPDGSYDVIRWPRGGGASIAPPPRTADGSYQGRPVVGEFHTHPNADVDENGWPWQESPSPGDITGVRAERYTGDSFVIGHTNVYRIGSDGAVSRVGLRDDVLQ